MVVVVVTDGGRRRGYCLQYFEDLSYDRFGWIGRVDHVHPVSDSKDFALKRRMVQNDFFSTGQASRREDICGRGEG